MRLAVSIPHLDTFADEELYAFCRANPELRIERNEKGQIVIMPLTGIETSFRNSDLLAEVNFWNRKIRLGKVSSNGGYTLPDTSMRAPDLAWISNERLATITPDDLKRFAHVCPDFVVELMSESDNMDDLKQKMQKWIENGVRLGWLIDPKKKQTFVYRAERGSNEEELLLFSDVLDGGDVLPGLEIILSEIF